MTYTTYADAQLTNADSVSEDFSSPTGEWINYYAYGSDNANSIVSSVNKQKHTDIRSFKSTSLSPRRLIDLCTSKVGNSTGDLGNTTMPNMAVATSSSSEIWTAVSGSPTLTVGKNSTTGWNQLKATLTADTVLSSTGSLINLSSYSDDDFITIAISSLPSGLNLSTSYILFTDNSNAEAKIYFNDPSDSGEIKISSTAGAKELKFKLSRLSGITKSEIKTVKFGLVGATSEDFICNAIRCVSSTWKYAPVDFNTITQTLCKTVPPDGSSSTYTFPTATSGSLDSTTTWPTLIKSFDTSLSNQDPKVVNGTISSLIYTGSATNATNSIPNKFDLYFRVAPKLYNQNTYNGSSNPYGLGGKTQTQINNLSSMAPKSLTDLTINQVATNINYIKTSLIWYTSSTKPVFKIQIKNTYNSNVLYDITLDDVTSSALQNSNISFTVSLYDNMIIIRIYKKNTATNKFSLVYSTGRIYSDNFYKQRGRIGWNASFADGDPFIEKIKSQGLVYAEYETVPMTSITPVKGAQLYADASASFELFNYPLVNSFTSWKSTATVVADIDKNKPKTSTKVTCATGVGIQGIQTSKFKIEDYRDIKIDLKIWFPNINANLIFLLYNEADDIYIPVTTPYFIKNQWSKIDLKISDSYVLPGDYRLVILQTSYNLSTNWWISEPHIAQTQVEWQARSKSGGPKNIDAENWINFEKAADLKNGSVLFSKVGKELQIRGLAKTQHAIIKSIKIDPMYATLGNFVWRD